uniref:TLC domain-containing protein n=1 Tax=Physcomitrium patens TaxID=3218 RepID=A0A7I4DGW1_PHYPA
MSSQADFITMMIPGFTTPGSTTLRRAVPFHDNMDMLFGEWSGGGEIALWFGSVLSGIMFCKLMYDFSKDISPNTFPGYNKLTRTQKVEWNNRAFSTAHAFVSSAIAFYLLYVSDIFRDSAPYGPVMFRSSILSQFGLGLLHHLVSMLALILAVHSGHAHLYLYIVLLSECTTPFINLRWYRLIIFVPFKHPLVLDSNFQFSNCVYQTFDFQISK